MLIKCIIILSVVLLASANVIPETCRTDIEVIPTFDLDKYMGHWYEAQVYSNHFTKSSECVWANYTKTGDNSFSAEHSSIRNEGPRQSHSASGVLVDPSAGKVALAYHPKSPGTESNYNILDTDYENFAIIWSCMKFRGKNMAWILSRTPELNSAVMGRVDAIVEKYLEKEKFMTRSIAACNY